MILTIDVASVNAVYTVPRIITLLKETGACATFFVVGSIAKHHPALVKEIGERFEVGAHGLNHVDYRSFCARTLAYDVLEAKRAIEKTGVPCHGFRSPYNTIPTHLFRSLSDAGYVYDSSVNRSYFPGRYNNRNVPPWPYQIEVDGTHRKVIQEIPISSRSFLKMPFGLTFARLFPRLYMTNPAGIHDVFYFHDYDVPPRDGRPRGILQGCRYRYLRQNLEVLKEFISCGQSPPVSCIQYLRKHHAEYLANHG